MDPTTQEASQPQPPNELLIAAARGLDLRLHPQVTEADVPRCLSRSRRSKKQLALHWHQALQGRVLLCSAQSSALGGRLPGGLDPLLTGPNLAAAAGVVLQTLTSERF